MIKNEAEKAYRKAMDEAITGLIDEETGFATTQRKPFADGCHVFGVLSEEWNEAIIHIQTLTDLVVEFQTNCISGDMPSEIKTKEHLMAIREHCEKAMLEIMQVGAVAEKGVETLENWLYE